MNDDLLVWLLLSTSFPSHLSIPERLWKWSQQFCPWLLRGIAILYGMVSRLPRVTYQQGWLQQHHLPQPVVSIGNITVGGTGKTPFVIWVAHQLHAKGKRVAILSRGYGRQHPSNNLIVSDGKGHVKDWRVSGDEPVVIAQQCPWAIVAVGPDRFRLGLWVLEQTTCDCFLLDDGYQHLSLYRDVDVVLFDATDVQGLCGVLPAGRLREPLKGAQGADALIITRADSLSAIQPVQHCIEKSLGHPIHPIVMKSTVRGVQHLVSGDVKSAESISNAALLVVSGIGNPRAFLDMLVACGATILDDIQFSDHCDYDQSEVSLIRTAIAQLSPDMVLTTEKDAVKLREWFTPDDPVWFMTIDLDILDGEADLRNLLDRVGTG